MKEDHMVQKQQQTLMIAGAIVLALAVGFFSGTQYQQTRLFGGMMRQFGISGTGFGEMGYGSAGNGGARNDGTQGRTGRMGIRPVSGEIVKTDDTSITVKAADGSSRIVILSEKTEINKADTAVKSDLKVGEKVAVFGQENTDGSITAQNIQLNPLNRGMMGVFQTK